MSSIDRTALADKFREAADYLERHEAFDLGTVCLPLEELRFVEAALRSASSAEEMRERDFEMVLRRIVHRHRKGFDVTLLVESARDLLARKGTHSVLRDNALPLPAEPGPGQVDGWQPIETAPKDGRPIPCLSPEYRPEPVMLSYYRHNGLEAWRDWDQDVHCPTHWCPLPPPPKEPAR